MKTKNVLVTDDKSEPTGKIQISDEGEIGFEVSWYEFNPQTRKFKLEEQVLIPRESVDDVCLALLKMSGATGIDWEREK